MVKLLFLEYFLQKINSNGRNHINKSMKKTATLSCFSTENDYIKSNLGTDFKVEDCPSDCCCFELEKLGSFSYDKSTWVSNCKNRMNKIECNHKDRTCANMSIKLNKRKELGVDVEERLCWGLDLYSRNLITFLLGNNHKDKIGPDFIEKSLIKSLNYLVNNL